MTEDIHHLVIPAGAKGGGKGKGGSGGGGGVEAPDTLRSIQYAKVIDLVSEGTIGGLANGLQSVYFDGVKLQNPNGSYNFNSVNVYWTTGAPGQAPMPGQSGVQAEHSVGVQIKTTTPATRTITNPDTDRVRVTVAVPSLQSADKKGNVNGTTVAFNLLLQSNGGGYKLIKNASISGKTTGRYQRSITFALTGSPPWDVRIVRVTPDSTSNLLANDLYWDTYAELIDVQMRYRNSAVIGIAIDAAQFSSIPSRVYDIVGMNIQVPTNYNPAARTYSGVWDGTFKLAYSNNPAWIFYDLVTNTRYGIGTFIGATQVDKFALYAIGKWCDEYVPDGKNGYEPRWVCNAVITDRQEAFDTLQSLASVFRGAHFWTGGQLITIADKPTDALGLYTNANVVDGVFTYQGSDLRARHTQVAVTWNDPQNLGQPRVSLVEDQDAISRYGLNRLDLTGVGCTSEGQAIRIGKWALYTENNETETVKFSVGLDGAWCRPGDVIQVADLLVSGERRGGRLEQGTDNNTLVLDYPVTFHDTSFANAAVIRGDGTTQVVSVVIPALETPISQLDTTSLINPAPLVGSPWVLSTGDLQTQLFRVIAVEQADDSITFTITALSHNPSKWNYVELGLALADRDVTNLGLPVVSNLTAQDTLVSITGAILNITMNIAWQSTAPQFEVRYHQLLGNWTVLQTQSLTIDVPVVEDTYEIVVTPINSAGIRGTSATLTHQVLGLAGTPNPIKNFRIQNVNGMAHLTWAPATDFDVLVGGIFELRFAPRTTGIDWNSANVIVTAIPGTATTVEVPYRTGTYLIKARDSSGIYSADAALVITSGADPNHITVQRLCESPDWPGVFDGTFVQLPQQWLVLSATGGLWDDQLPNIDDWPDTDTLPLGANGQAPGTGYYYYNSQIDMGGVFTVRLTSDMLAFSFIAGTVFVDDRPGNVDTWNDWDAASPDANGMAVLEMRQTNDDPASSGAVWSAWAGMQASDYTGRGFQFRIRLEAPAGQVVAVEESCVNADVSAKQDSKSDTTWTGVAMSFTFGITFFSTPAIAIAIQQAVTGDYAVITAKSATGFTIEIRNASNALIAAGTRTFDWQAQGF